MSGKPIEQRIEDAFDDATSEAFGQKYLELLYTNWFEIMRSARRAVLWGTLLTLSFFLLDHAKTGALRIGPLETSNVASVLALLPAVVSYLLFEAIDLTVSAAYYRDAAGALIKKMHQPVWDNDLEYLLEPASTFAWGGGSNLTGVQVPGRRLAGLVEHAAYAAILTTWGAAVVFLGYAYVTLFQSAHTNRLVVVGSLVFTLFNLLRAALQGAVIYTVY